MCETFLIKFYNLLQKKTEIIKIKHILYISIFIIKTILSIFSSLSKLISKSKSQSLLPSSSTTTTDPITTQQHHKVSSSLLPLNCDGVNNNKLTLLKVTANNNEIDFPTPDNNGNNNNPYTAAAAAITTLCNNSENALPNFLKGGLRKSLTQVSNMYIFIHLPFLLFI